MKAWLEAFFAGFHKRRAAANDADSGFAALRGGYEPEQSPNPRLMLIILSIMTAGIIFGGIYFVNVLAGFKAAIDANQTMVAGPYPNAAVIYVVIPAYFGLLYLLLDHFRLRTDLSLKSPQGIAAGIVIALLLALLSWLPVAVIRHKTNDFANQRGFIDCASPFDPAHVHVYALQSYVDTVGCPTVTIQQ